MATQISFCVVSKEIVCLGMDDTLETNRADTTPFHTSLGKGTKQKGVDNKLESMEAAGNMDLACRG